MGELLTLALGVALVALAGAYAWPLGLLAGLLLTWLIWRHLQRFGAQTRLFAQRLMAGDLGARYGSREAGPLGDAQAALESMAQGLQTEGRELAQTLRKQERALQGMQDGVLICGEQGEVLLMNASFRSLLRAEVPLARRYSYTEAFREPALHQALQAALTEGRRSALELTHVAGGERFARAVVTPFDSPEAGGAGAVALVFDQTEEKRLERMRSDFVSNVSHELRTPLTAIKAALETLRDGAVDDPKVNHAFLDKALHHSERLQELISDLLALAGIEEKRRLGQVEGQAQAALGKAAEEAQAALEESVRRHQGALRFELQAGLPLLRCEPGDLRQILVNLIENALKYAGPQPQVSVRARTLGEQVELEVIDQGPGIPLEDQKRVFERFYRVDKARTRDSGGSGLGLAIVKHLAENQGGSVGLESLEGKGCRFWVRLSTVSPSL